MVAKLGKSETRTDLHAVTEPRYLPCDIGSCSLASPTAGSGKHKSLSTCLPSARMIQKLEHAGAAGTTVEIIKVSFLGWLCWERGQIAYGLEAEASRCPPIVRVPADI